MAEATPPLFVITEVTHTLVVAVGAVGLMAVPLIVGAEMYDGVLPVMVLCGMRVRPASAG